MRWPTGSTGMQRSAQSIAFTTTTFGGMLASLIGGLLYDHLSVVTTLYIALAIGIIGAFIMILGIRDKERQTDQKRSDMI
ncbi:MAG: hypothetical protein II153_06560 [Erysipelotrichaceae bacterium]|nr:hypothetical protein [Erysipelotrichaceae bacterium]